MRLIIGILFISISITTFSQCLDGTIGITGSGCGCLSGCNLTSLGGPNCSPAVSGSCSAGYLPMSVDINVPNGCSVTVNATMRNRAGGCTASGADGDCQTCDVVKVDLPGGGKTFQQGGSNSTLNDSYTLIGPGTIRVSGRANRADEIITYTVSSVGANGSICSDCISTLPIELIEFKADLNGESVDLTWMTATEINNDYFTIERSKDGIVFEPYHRQNGQGNSTTIHHYKTIDHSPLIGRSYYRLKQTDFNGVESNSQIRTVYNDSKINYTISPNPTKNEFRINGENIENAEIQILNSLGQAITLFPQVINDNELKFDRSNLPSGNYIVKIIFSETTSIQKLVVL